MARKSTEHETIKAATVNRVTEKATGKYLGFLVKSNGSEDYYQVTAKKVAGMIVWSCTCKAGQHGFCGCKAGHCCHVQAVIEVAEARKQLVAERVAAQVAEIVEAAEVQQGETVEVAPATVPPARPAIRHTLPTLTHRAAIDEIEQLRRERRAGRRDTTFLDATPMLDCDLDTLLAKSRLNDFGDFSLLK